MEPLVSVLIPNYNYSQYVEECVQSVLNQTYKNLEIVILDNASTDKSVELCRKFKDGRVRLCQNQVNVVSTSYRILAEQLMTGKYGILLCSDDSFEPEFIEKAVKIMEEHPNVSYVHGDRWWISPEGKKMPLDPFFKCSFVAPGVSAMPLYMVTTLAHPSSGVFRVDAFRQLGGYNVENTLANADKPLWFYLSFYGDYGYIRGHMTNIRLSGAASQTSVTLKCFQYLTLFYLQYVEFIDFAKFYGIQSVLDRKDECMVRCSKDLMKFSSDFILEGDFVKAKQYFDFCKIINPDIANDEMFEKLYGMILAKKVDVEYVRGANPVVYDKKRSYEPPKGYKKIKV